LEEDEHAVEEVEVPDAADEAEVQGPGEESHEPLVDVVARLHVLHLEMLAEIRQIVLEHLFE